MNVGDQLRAAREAHGWSRREAAQRSGVSYATLISAEAGLSTWASARKLAGAYGKRIAVIAARTRKMSVVELAEASGLSVPTVKDFLTLVEAPNLESVNLNIASVETIAHALSGKVVVQ